MEEYDPAKDIWKAKTDMPTARWYLSSCTLVARELVSEQQEFAEIAYCVIQDPIPV